MSAAKPLSTAKRLENYGTPLTVAQARQVRKTEQRLEHDRPREQRRRVSLTRRLRRERSL